VHPTCGSTPSSTMISKTMCNHIYWYNLYHRNYYIGSVLIDTAHHLETTNLHRLKWYGGTSTILVLFCHIYNNTNDKTILLILKLNIHCGFKMVASTNRLVQSTSLVCLSLCNLVSFGRRYYSKLMTKN
jgi:hypothetical protein